MSDLILALIENAILQRKNMPPDAWENCRLAFARGRIQKSVELKTLFEANRHYCAKVLGDLIDELTGKKIPPPTRYRAFVASLGELFSRRGSHHFR
jgi:hypothetical protein